MGYSVRFAGSRALTKERWNERLAGQPAPRPEKAKEKPAGLRLIERRISPLGSCGRPYRDETSFRWQGPRAGSPG
jgi:hypothetical protein